MCVYVSMYVSKNVRHTENLIYLLVHTSYKIMRFLLCVCANKDGDACWWKLHNVVLYSEKYNRMTSHAKIKCKIKNI